MRRGVPQVVFWDFKVGGSGKFVHDHDTTAMSRDLKIIIIITIKTLTVSMVNPLNHYHMDKLTQPFFGQTDSVLLRVEHGNITYPTPDTCSVPTRVHQVACAVNTMQPHHA